MGRPVMPVLAGSNTVVTVSGTKGSVVAPLPQPGTPISQPNVHPGAKSVVVGSGSGSGAFATLVTTDVAATCIVDVASLPRVCWPDPRWGLNWDSASFGSVLFRKMTTPMRASVTASRKMSAPNLRSSDRRCGLASTLPFSRCRRHGNVRRAAERQLTCGIHPLLPLLARHAPCHGEEIRPPN